MSWTRGFLLSLCALYCYRALKKRFTSSRVSRCINLNVTRVCRFCIKVSLSRLAVEVSSIEMYEAGNYRISFSSYRLMPVSASISLILLSGSLAIWVRASSRTSAFAASIAWASASAMFYYLSIIAFISSFVTSRPYCSNTLYYWFFKTVWSATLTSLYEIG